MRIHWAETVSWRGGDCEKIHKVLALLCFLIKVWVSLTVKGVEKESPN